MGHHSALLTFTSSQCWERVAKCLHQSTAASTWCCGPDPVWVGSKWLLAIPRIPVTPGTPQFIFLPGCPLNDCGRAAHSFFKIGRLFSLFSCSSLARLRLLILLLLLMSVTFNPTLAPSFLARCALEI